MGSCVMPWMESSAACEQREFIGQWLQGEEPVSELCRTVWHQPEDGLQAHQPVQGVRLPWSGRPEQRATLPSQRHQPGGGQQVDRGQESPPHLGSQEAGGLAAGRGPRCGLAGSQHRGGDTGPGGTGQTPAPGQEGLPVEPAVHRGGGCQRRVVPGFQGLVPDRGRHSDRPADDCRMRPPATCWCVPACPSPGQRQCSGRCAGPLGSTVCPKPFAPIMARPLPAWHWEG